VDRPRPPDRAGGAGPGRPAVAVRGAQGPAEGRRPAHRARRAERRRDPQAPLRPRGRDAVARDERARPRASRGDRHRLRRALRARHRVRGDPLRRRRVRPRGARAPARPRSRPRGAGDRHRGPGGQALRLRAPHAARADRRLH
ncbi:MAG: Flagellar motor switch protein FliG, partial [uncultured Solirubrobacteraceae bacterium]